MEKQYLFFWLKHIFIPPFIFSGGWKIRDGRTNKFITPLLDTISSLFVLLLIGNLKAHKFCQKSFLIQPFIFAVAEKVVRKLTFFILCPLHLSASTQCTYIIDAIRNWWVRIHLELNIFLSYLETYIILIYIQLQNLRTPFGPAKMIFLEILTAIVRGESSSNMRREKTVGTVSLY